MPATGLLVNLESKMDMAKEPIKCVEIHENNQLSFRRKSKYVLAPEWIVEI